MKAIFLTVLALGYAVSATTEGKARVQIQNTLDGPITNVTLLHIQRTAFLGKIISMNNQTWGVVEPGRSTLDHLEVDFEAGFGSDHDLWYTSGVRHNSDKTADFFYAVPDTHVGMLLRNSLEITEFWLFEEDLDKTVTLLVGPRMVVKKTGTECEFRVFGSPLTWGGPGRLTYVHGVAVSSAGAYV